MVDLFYRFEEGNYLFEVSEEAILDKLVEYADKFYQVVIDGKSNSIWNLFNELDIDLEDIAETGDVGKFVHAEFEDSARQAFEDEKLLTDDEA